MWQPQSITQTLGSYLSDIPSWSMAFNIKANSWSKMAAGTPASKSIFSVLTLGESKGRQRASQAVPVIKKKPTCQCRRCRRHKFDPWVGKILWRRAWQPAPLCLPGESYRQRSLVGYSPWGRKESDMTEQLHFYFHFLYF